MMRLLQNPEFISGMLSSAIIALAAIKSSLFRNLGLAALAALVVWTFVRFDGVTGVVRLFKLIGWHFAVHPAFCQGAVAGAVVTIAAMLVIKDARSSNGR
jgi:hypothetical protein